jgi:hypothetical protein
MVSDWLAFRENDSCAIFCDSFCEFDADAFYSHPKMRIVPGIGNWQLASTS